MKNLKNIVAALTLTITVGFGATAANAGMLISDKANRETTPCAAKKTRTLFQTGIIIIGKAGMLISDGLLVSDGLLMSDGLIMSDSVCKDGMLISDGLMVSDGMLISD